MLTEILDLHRCLSSTITGRLTASEPYSTTICNEDSTMPDSKSPLARTGVRTLVDRCLNGDVDAWDVLVYRYNSRVAVYALRASGMLASPHADRSEVCRELIQEAYLRLL